MPIKGSFTLKSKTKKSNYGDQFTPEQKKEYWANKRKQIEQKKLEFVEKVIEYAKSNQRFPWEVPNFTIFPKSVYKQKQIEKFEKAHPDMRVPSKAAEYQGSNVIMLNMLGAIAGYKDSRWITLPHIWKLGGQISEYDRKNSGVEILLVNPEGKIKRKQNEETGEWETVYQKNWETGEFLLDKKGNKIPVRVPTYAFQTVYNVEVVNGLNLPPEKLPPTLTVTEKCPEMESIIAHSEAPVIHDQNYGLKRYYQPGLDEIHVPPVEMFKSMTAYYSTVAHEIGHSTGHPKRLNREILNQKGSRKYAREELVAELTSVFLSQELGIQIPPKEITSHMEYLRGWDEKIQLLTEKPEELYAVISDAEKATKYIKDHMLEKELKHDNVLMALKEMEKSEKTKEKTEEKPKQKTIKKTKSKGMER